MNNLPGSPADQAANENSNLGGARPSPHPSDVAVRQIVRQAINASPLLEVIVDDWQSYAHWGINE
jgi:hypothetical protein